jgi:hypothetical protein
MNHKPLSKTNPYLRDRSTYEKYLFASVASSATIELGRLSAAMVRALKEKHPAFIFISPEIEKDLSQ